jgi:hypothetical protein
MGDELKCKGAHVIIVRDWIDARLGTGTFAKLAASNQHLANRVILPGVWYDLDPLIDVLVEASKRTDKSVDDITAEVAKQNALQDLKTMYRAFMRILHPVNVMRFTPQLWRNYVHFGEAKVLKNEPTHYVAECARLPERALDWACGGWRGVIPTAIAVSGGKNALGQVILRERVGSGLQRLVFEVKYEL